MRAQQKIERMLSWTGVQNVAKTLFTEASAELRNLAGMLRQLGTRNSGKLLLSIGRKGNGVP